MSRRPYDYVKRILDAVGAAVLLVVAAPVVGVVAILVRLRLGSPVLFEQQRPGRDGKPFVIRKFRTMLEPGSALGLLDDETRLTPFGRTLRSTSLDELPALWNVLRGDMSFVGPRPLLMRYLSLYSEEQSRRHEVRPGITGLSQVSGRNRLGWDERLALDVAYVESRSWWLDVRILAQTIGVVLSRDGVSAEGHVTMEEFRGSDRPTDEAW
jgi:lipopolysaccharide/colanic/teichoic acid biosynthesis glycosyltransferase